MNVSREEMQRTGTGNSILCSEKIESINGFRLKIMPMVFAFCFSWKVSSDRDAGSE